MELKASEVLGRDEELNALQQYSTGNGMHELIQTDSSGFPGLYLL